MKSEVRKNRSLWYEAIIKICNDKIALLSLCIVVFYASVAILVSLGLLAGNWDAQVGQPNLKPSFDYLLGTDFLGRDIFTMLIYGTQVAMSVGFVSSLIAVPIGVGLGALAGYFGEVVDEIIVWLYTTFSSIPTIMLLISITFVLGKGITSVYIALGLTSWVPLCRLVRGEVIKHKNREYVQAATAIGGGHFRKLFKHIIPNVTHIVIINTSLQFQVAIKSEVILSYLGLGVQERPSWGLMIDDARTELVNGVWWKFAGATIAMFFIVLAFNFLGDALRDALDPKLKGKD
jgi:peptide/nickel transport system permease protein